MEFEYTYWEENDWFVGYFNKYPEYVTQGQNLAELEEMLADVYVFLQEEDIVSRSEQRKTGTIRLNAEALA
jgi:predicted RNase H-like HicB family nuclease